MTERKHARDMTPEEARTALREMQTDARRAEEEARSKRLLGDLAKKYPDARPRKIKGPT